MQKKSLFIYDMKNIIKTTFFLMKWAKSKMYLYRKSSKALEVCWLWWIHHSQESVVPHPDFSILMKSIHLQMCFKHSEYFCIYLLILCVILCVITLCEWMYVIKQLCRDAPKNDDNTPSLQNFSRFWLVKCLFNIFGHFARNV